MRKSIYVNINKNYTATVYSLADLKSYCQFEGIKPLDVQNFTFHQKETGCKRLSKSVQIWLSMPHLCNELTSKNKPCKMSGKADGYKCRFH